VGENICLKDMILLDLKNKRKISCLLCSHWY